MCEHALVVLSNDRPSIPDSISSEPHFLTVTSVLRRSDPSLNPERILKKFHFNKPDGIICMHDNWKVKKQLFFFQCDQVITNYNPLL